MAAIKRALWAGAYYATVALFIPLQWLAFGLECVALHAHDRSLP